MRLRREEGGDAESLEGWKFFLIEVNLNLHLATTASRRSPPRRTG